MRSEKFIPLLDGKPGAYGVVFPDAPGCAAMGGTKASALRDAYVALTEWLDYREDEDQPPPDPRTIDELRADPEVAEALAEGAELIEM